MAAAISNDSPLNVGNAKTRAPELDVAATRREAAAAESAPVTSDDTVTLSEAALRLADDVPKPQTREDARDLLERLKEKLAANPGFAAAAHRASDNSRLATLLDGYA